MSVDPIQRYSVEIAGAALRHDFGIPLGAIGRKAGFLLELIDDGQLDHLPSKTLRQVRKECAAIADLSEKVHRSTLNLGTQMRSQNLYEIESNYRLLNEALTPLFDELSRRSKLLAELVMSTKGKDRGSKEYVLAIGEGVAKARAMYAGIAYFVRPTSHSADLYVPIEIHHLCEDVCKRVVSSQDIRSKPQIYINGHALIEGVHNQIAQIVQNVVGNAVKFTSDLKEARVTIEIRTSPFHVLQQHYFKELTGYNGRGNWLELKILDNGPGVRAELKNAIFQLYFSRNPDPNTNVPRSTGMGLAIAKLAAIMHGGLIFVEPGSFASFVIVLPIRRQDGISLKLLTAREYSL